MSSNVIDDYDHNFCLAVPRNLENDRVKLIPFVPSVHAQPFVDAARPYPEVYNWLTVGPYTNVEHFMTSFYSPMIHKNQSFVLFLLIDKTRPSSTTGGIAGEEGAIAGHIAYMNTSERNLVTEIGFVLILSPFQRTHVTSNAVGLMMHYMLDTPEQRGLGWRRVFWHTNALNLASRRTAERLGYRFEGILRWDRVLPPNKQQFGNGIKVRKGDSRGEECVGRDTATFSHCWDDWEDGGREKVDAIMARTA